MLMDRLYQPASDELVYHYCSASTFQAIATSGTIRFSDINMLNDESEVRWAYSVFEEAATRLIKRIGISASAPAIDVSFVDSIDEIISPIQLIAHPFIACFSLTSDLLGQWRAYADDGKGFAVGFRAESLKRQLPATFLKVIYDRELQIREMMQAIVAIYLRQQEGNDSDRSAFLEDCVLLGTYMTSLKHPAFAEEREIRAVHVVNIKSYGNLAKFVDRGGIVDDHTKVDGNPVSFQVRDNHLVAFTDVTLTPNNTASPIAELVLGPKNHSAPGNLCLFLGGLGYTDITLRKSSAPYR
jgi:hypothetical protein